MLLEIIAFIVVGYFVLGLISTAWGQLLAIIAFIAIMSAVYPPAAAIAGIALAGAIVYQGLVGGDEDLFWPAVVILLASVGPSIELAKAYPYEVGLVVSVALIGALSRHQWKSYREHRA